MSEGEVSCAGGGRSTERRQQGGVERRAWLQGVHQSWSEVLRGLRDRGMGCPRLVVGDGHLGIWGALRNVYPDAAEQRCWNHKIINVLDRLPKRRHESAKLMLRNIPYAESRSEAERLRDVFGRWAREHSYEGAAQSLERDWERMVTFYDFPSSTGDTSARPTLWSHRSLR